MGRTGETTDDLFDASALPAALVVMCDGRVTSAAQSPLSLAERDISRLTLAAETHKGQPGQAAPLTSTGNDSSQAAEAGG